MYFTHKFLRAVVGLALFQVVCSGINSQPSVIRYTLVLDENNQYRFALFEGATRLICTPVRTLALNVEVDGSPISVIANIINNKSKNWMLVSLGNAELVSNGGWLREKV